jgi:phosphoglycerol transferase
MNVSRSGAGLARCAAPYAFPLALLAVLLYLMLRNTGPYPVVFADEWFYSKFARLQPLSESQLPSYLYLKLFGLSSACGDGYLQCTRLLNAVLFVAAGPLIYRCARTVLAPRQAALVAVLSVLAPANSYTAYFMPEAMYFFGFWLFSYAALCGGERPVWGYGLLTGVLLGLLSLIKVHALFLLPALLVYIVAVYRSAAQPRWLPLAISAAGQALGSALATKLLLGYLLAGRAGLSLFGSFYGGHVHNSGHGLARLLAPMLYNLHGHAMALVLLFAFPLLVLAASATSRAQRDALGRPLRNLLLYALLMLGAALAMTAAYTASIADAGPLEGSRLHLRYYDFVFPLLLIGASAGAAAGARLSLRHRAVLAALLAALLLYSAARLLPAYAVSLIDSPEIYTMSVSRPVFHALAALELALLALWTLRPHRAAPAFLMVLLPLFMLAGESVSHTLLSRARQSNAYDRAGMMAHTYLDAGQRDTLAIAGDNLSGLARAQFHVDSAAASTIELAPDAPFDATQAPVRKKWLLLVGPHALPAGWTPVLSTPDYALLRVAQGGTPLYQIAFAQPLAGGALDHVSGLADAEDWGSWSNAKTVTLHFAKPLPPHLTLLLSGRAFGPNVGLPFQASAGGASVAFKLPASSQELFLQLDTDGAQHELTITVPQPTTPEALGAGHDTRQLGIGLISLEVGAAH